ncbi:DUF6056 family protein [Companilactobacillus ginsenosidimutans]|uniref:Teichoic acid polysaccharide export protein n=1 Tax=Companilactobacillus ginsenosidimutans TaxID=1007676 RepID=A0A0H4R1R2_9LACO|nr:DUF6056 family protein [Companilactobacillus ginsenosidimutans]AKP67675.1 hypothetical protein ABM34_09140 [Companilactobacillus ginsenosidimutans]
MTVKVNFKRVQILNTLIFAGYFIYFAIFRDFVIPSADDYFWYGPKGAYLLRHFFYGPQEIYGGSSNGRYLGNLFEIVTIRHLWISMIVFAVFWTLLVWCIWQLSNKSNTSLWLSFLFIFTMQTAFMNNLLVWNAGFVNYVPPIALLLFYLVILFNTGEKIQKLKVLPWITLGLGLVTGLFMESITIVQLLIGIATVLFLRKNIKSFHLTYLLGSIFSIILMFLHPSYRDHQTYRATTTDLSDIWRIYSDMTHFWLITFNLFLLMIILVAIGIIIIKSKMNVFAKVPLLASTGFFSLYYLFINYDLRKNPMSYSYTFNDLDKHISNPDAIISIIFVVFIGLCIGLFFKKDVVMWSFYLLAGVFTAEMLLVSSPISSRPYFFPYVFMYLIGIRFFHVALSKVRIKSIHINFALATILLLFSINHQHKMVTNYQANLIRVSEQSFFEGGILKDHLPHRKYVYVNDEFDQQSGSYWKEFLISRKLL